MLFPYQESHRPVEDRVSDLLSRMTLREKIGQLCQTPMLEYASHRTAYLQGASEGCWGSRILADTAWAGNAEGETVDPRQLNEIQRAAVEQSRLGIPMIFARDVIYGQRTVLPIPLAQAASWNPTLVEDAYRCIAKEAASLGIHWTFAPMLDIVRDPRWGRVIESSGEDPYLTSQFAKAVVKGFQGDDLTDPASLVACAKHFVGYGAAEGGRDYDTTEISPNTLHNVYLPPFQAAVEAGVATVMSGFNDLGGTPVSGSHALIQSWLKQAQGFKGFVVSDWGSISDLSYFGVAGGDVDAAALALNAGVDMAMTNEAYEHYLERALEEDKTTLVQLNDAVSRVLRVKFEAGLFEHPYVDETWHQSVLYHPTHVATAQSLAEQSMVLLKNHQRVLPLNAAQPLTVAVIGPHAHTTRQHLGSWCLDGRADDVTSIYAGMTQYLTQQQSPITLLTEHTALSDEMVECAHRADIVILCTGESHRRTGEARNIAELMLPAGQEELIAAIGRIGKPLVVVQCTGRPLPSAATEQYADALLYAWQSGTETGHAVARLLFGEVSPSGRLPMSVPRSTGQIPMYYGRKPLGKMRDFQSYQPYKDLAETPLYPFGYGLGYGEIRYQDVQVSASSVALGESISVSVTVVNDGEQTMTEVAQCYIRQAVASTTRPVRELKDFCRVTVEPGESKRVVFTLTPDKLAFWGIDPCYQQEASRIDIFVGADSTATLSTSVEVLNRQS